MRSARPRVPVRCCATPGVRTDMDQQTIEIYNQSAKQIAALHENLTPEDIYQLVDHFFVRGAACADIGCGIGRDSYWLSQQGYPVTGIDAAEGMLLEARHRYPKLHFIHDSLPLLNKIKDSDFTNVLCSAVIMHLESNQLETAILNLLRNMTVGGVRVISFLGTDNDNNRENGKLYTKVLVNEVIANFSGYGANILDYKIKNDLERNLKWHNLVFRKLTHLAV